MDFNITHNLHSSFVQMTSLGVIVEAMRCSERLKEAGICHNNKDAAPFLLEYVQYPVRKYDVKAFRMIS